MGSVHESAGVVGCCVVYTVSVHEKCDCVRSFRYVCELVCVVVDASVLVSIVVSIPACHAGDPGSIPGREAFAHCSLLIAHCSLLFALWSVLSSFCCVGACG